jgi:magnesium-transporting ATPase (P-type)
VRCSIPCTSTAPKRPLTLKVSVALKERVLRDGQEVTVRGQELVTGDVVLLAAGDLVPADGRVLEARHFFVLEETSSTRSRHAKS